MRGEGNHKIPGSFAPENMEKTGAERVKYSLACQHEDAIPIKFVSYAQKCPTVLCTFAVALRKESVDRNLSRCTTLRCADKSLSARRAWIEIFLYISFIIYFGVALRKESVDRNFGPSALSGPRAVALRKESVDRNIKASTFLMMYSWSLSARRAWIEIIRAGPHGQGPTRRSPQGERG